MSNVERLARVDLEDPTDITPPKAKVPALGMSLQVDLGAGRVCTLQTFVSSDCSVVELNQMLDKMTAAGARQRSSYKIEELERDLEKLQREHDQQVEDLAKVDEDFEAAQAKRQEEGAQAIAALEKFRAGALAATTASGRREAKMNKQDESYAKRVEDGIEKIKAAIKAAADEHARVRGEIEKTMIRRQEVIEKTRAEIARCKEIVAAGLKA